MLEEINPYSIEQIISIARVQSILKFSTCTFCISFLTPTRASPRVIFELGESISKEHDLRQKYEKKLRNPEADEKA